MADHIDIAAMIESSPIDHSDERHDDDIALTDEDDSQKLSNTTFLRSKNGIMLIINTVLLMICWVIVTGWRAKVTDRIEDEVESQTFFLIVTIFSFIINTILLVTFIPHLHEKYLDMVNWPAFLIVLCVVEALLVLTVSAVLFAEVQSINIHCRYVKCSGLRAAGSFGIFAFIGLVAHACILFKNVVSKRSN